jgi:hypothetical protein
VLFFKYLTKLDKISRYCRIPAIVWDGEIKNSDNLSRVYQPAEVISPTSKVGERAKAWNLDYKMQLLYYFIIIRFNKCTAVRLQLTKCEVKLVSFL